MESAISATHIIEFSRSMGELTGVMRALVPRVESLEIEMRNTRQQISDHAHLVAKIEGLEDRLSALQKSEEGKQSFFDGIKAGGKGVVVTIILITVLAARGFVETAQGVFDWIISR